MSRHLLCSFGKFLSPFLCNSELITKLTNPTSYFQKNTVKMQQQPMFRAMPSFPSTNITTDQIQKYLDENKKLILAILDSQNLGKLAECAQYQAQLQKNLMYLAAIADGQPHTQAMTPQMTPHPAMLQGSFYMQQAQAAAMAQQQPGMFTQRPPFNSPHSMQPNQVQMAKNPIAPTDGPQKSGNLRPGANPGITDTRSGNKQNRSDASPDRLKNSGEDGNVEDVAFFLNCVFISCLAFFYLLYFLESSLWLVSCSLSKPSKIAGHRTISMESCLTVCQLSPRIWQVQE